MSKTQNQFLWPVHDVALPRKDPDVSAVKAATSQQPARKTASLADTKLAPTAPPTEQQRSNQENKRKENAQHDAAHAQPKPSTTLPPALSLVEVTRKKPVIASLSKPPPRPERPRLRGSLSEQLANITVQSDTMISGLKQAVSKDGGELGTPKLLVYCSHMIVGRAESQFAAAVSFHVDRVSYAFQHARERRIDMLMFYEDMRNVMAEDKKATLSFRVCKVLEHFKHDYDPNDTAHVLTIPFARSDYAAFKGKVLPLILALAK